MASNTRRPPSTPPESPFNQLPATAVLVAGVVLSLAVFLGARLSEQAEFDAEFGRQALNRAYAVQRTIATNLQVIESVAAFYTASNDVTRDEFHGFTRPLLDHDSAIQAIEWAPRVPRSQRAQYEEAARRDGLPGFRITEKAGDGAMVEAADRDEYFPVYLAEPDHGNETAIGFDLASDPAREKALRMAAATGRMHTTGRLTLIQEASGQYGFLVFLPVYSKGAPTDSGGARRDNLRGFALGVFRAGDLIRQAMADLVPDGMDLYLLDESAPENERLLHFHPSRTRPDQQRHSAGDRAVPTTGLHQVHALDVPGRKWSLACAPTPGHVAEHVSWQPWAILCVGLTLTAVGTAYLATSAHQRRDLQREVAERKHMMLKLAELSITDDLTSVANRRHLMTRLHEEILRSSRTGLAFTLLMMDLDRFKRVNDDHGHQAGDKMLKDCAATLVDMLRGTDFVARYGGDEFCVLLLDVSVVGAERVAEKVRTALATRLEPAVTASIGIAVWRPGVTADSMLREADIALYKAKQKGRNQACLHIGPQTSASPPPRHQARSCEPVALS